MTDIGECSEDWVEIGSTVYLRLVHVETGTTVDAKGTSRYLTRRDAGEQLAALLGQAASESSE